MTYITNALFVVLLLLVGSSTLLLAGETYQPTTASTGESFLMATATLTVYDFTLNDIDGNPSSLKAYRGKVLLLVNTASFCGNTPQYEGLQTIYDQYRQQGFEILAFPANNFGKQEPGSDEEIKSFCFTKYSLTFPLFSKISVKGEDTHPLYQYLTEQSPFPGEVEWNFQKYLVDRQGNVVGKYRPSLKPRSPQIIQDIERVLGTSQASLRQKTKKGVSSLTPSS